MNSHKGGITMTPSGPLSPPPLPVGSNISIGDPKAERVSPALPLGMRKNILISPSSPPKALWQAFPCSLPLPPASWGVCRGPLRKGGDQTSWTANPQGLAEGSPSFCPSAPALLALHLAGGLVEGIPQDGVLLLQASQLHVGAILQLLLQSPDLEKPNRS